MLRMEPPGRRRGRPKIFIRVDMQVVSATEEDNGISLTGAAQ